MAEKRRKKKKLGSYPYLSVVFSITLALFVTGLFGLLLLHAQKLTGLIQENIEIQIYLNKFTTENERIKIHKTLSAKDYTQIKDDKPLIKFISKEEAVKQFTNKTGEDPLNFLENNPLLDAYVVKIKPEYQNREALRRIKAEIESMNGVFEVDYLESFITSVTKNLTKLSLVFAGFSVVLIITVAILINNTIKLALFSQRFLIRSMQLVGATASFIQRPFLARSIFHGMLSGLLAAILLGALLYYAYNNVEDLNLLRDDDSLLILFGALVIFGGLLGFAATLRAIKKYLRMSLDELY